MSNVFLYAILGFVIPIQTAKDGVFTLNKLKAGSEVNIFDQCFLMTCKSMGVNMFGDFFKDNDNIATNKRLHDYVRRV